MTIVHNKLTSGSLPWGRTSRLRGETQPCPLLLGLFLNFSTPWVRLGSRRETFRFIFAFGHKAFMAFTISLVVPTCMQTFGNCCWLDQIPLAKFTHYERVEFFKLDSLFLVWLENTEMVLASFCESQDESVVSSPTLQNRNDGSSRKTSIFCWSTYDILETILRSPYKCHVNLCQHFNDLTWETDNEHSK